MSEIAMRYFFNCGLWTVDCGLIALNQIAMSKIAMLLLF